MKQYFKICILLILLFIISNITIFKKCEFFTNDNINKNINFYVITLKNPDRLKNIDTQNKKLNANIIMIDAVNGIYINQNDLLQKGELSNIFFNNNELKRNKEIGCYKSHYNIYNLINNTNDKKKYSIILEDDFNIIPDNIIEKIDILINTLNDLEFDIIFLGNTFDNHNDEIVKDNIYNINKNKFTIGTFAYLINNKNINKLIEHTKLIDSPIDNKIDTLIKNNKIIAYVVYPNLLNYIAETQSNII